MKTTHLSFYLSRTTYQNFILTLFLLFIALAACSSAPEENPTPGLNQTQAYETVAARITEVSEELATQAAQETVPTDTGLPEPTSTPGISETPPNPTAVVSTFTPTPTVAVSDCDRAEAGIPIDVTIPDDTQFAPGTAFVKTWRIVNIGSCSWTSGYSLVFFSGEKMGGPDVVPLNSDVAPGQVVDLSVSLIAPSNSGTYQGNWMLRNPSGVLFGIGPQGNSFFWVRIVVPGGAGTPSITPTITPTGSTTPSGDATATPTFTPTTGSAPEVIVNSFIAIEPDGFIDFDTGATNGSSGNDISYTTDQSNTHLLTTQGSAMMAIFGTQTPTYENCRNANLSSGSLTVESIPSGTYICYKTDQGRFGWLHIDGFDSSNFILSLTLLTWE